MRWLVTGGLGFIGSNFIRRALERRSELEIVNLDAMTYAANPANLRGVPRERYRFIQADICDREAVRDAVAGGVDAIVNFAAESHVDRSIHSAEAFIRTNVLGTQTLLDAARENGVARFLQVSTDEVYGDVQHGASRESDAIVPRSPYSAAKAGGDMMALACWSTFKTPVLVTRGSNTYGPYQYPEKLIPLFITNLIDDKPVPVYGDGMQIRDWIHVDDHVAGIMDVLERGEPGNVYNLGGENPRANIDVTRALIKLLGRSMDTHVKHVTDRLGHDRRYALNCEKAHALGWKPRVPFEDGIRNTVSWYCK